MSSKEVAFFRSLIGVVFEFLWLSVFRAPSVLHRVVSCTIVCSRICVRNFLSKLILYTLIFWYDVPLHHLALRVFFLVHLCEICVVQEVF